MRRTIVSITALAVVGLIGCGAASSGPIRDLIRQRMAARQDTSSTAGLEQVTMSYQGVERSYFVHVPDQLQGQKGAPAVIVFHGGQGDGTDAAHASQMTVAADQMGFVAIFPNSANKQWNDGRATTASNIDDVGFVRALIAQATTLYGVDPGNVFAAGISNGGIFTQRLACDAADAFDGFGVVAANLPADLQPRCHPSRAVPMIFFNGTTDAMMPWNGGEVKSNKLLGMGAGGAVLSHQATQDFWTSVDGCSAPSAAQALPDVAQDSTNVSRQEFGSCAGSAQLEFYTIAGGGHNWPGSDTRSSRFAGNVSQDISATQEILTFFSRYGL